MEMEIAYEFGFDAAHRFHHGPEGHPYRRLHGHSFLVEVALAGAPDPMTGFIVDFARLEAAGDDVRRTLDHAMLNEVPGLEAPSLENIARWVWARLAPAFPELCRVTVRRPSCRQSCVYHGRAATGPADPRSGADAEG